MTYNIVDIASDDTISLYLAAKISMSNGRIRYEDIEYDKDVFTYDPDGDDPVTEDTVVVIGTKEIKGPVTRVPKNYRPRFIVNRQLLIKKSNAYPDFSFWRQQAWIDTQRIRKAIAMFMKPESADLKRFAELDLKRYTTLLFGDMDHWYSACVSDGFPRDTRKLVKSNENEELHIGIGHLRNIHEHAAVSKVYFQTNKPLKPSRDTRSLEWYKNKYPGIDPWSFEARDSDIFLAGVISLTDIERELKQTSILLQGVTTEHILIDELTARY